MACGARVMKGLARNTRAPMPEKPGIIASSKTTHKAVCYCLIYSRLLSTPPLLDSPPQLTSSSSSFSSTVTVTDPNYGKSRSRMMLASIQASI